MMRRSHSKKLLMAIEFFGTEEFIFGIVQKQGFFIIRQHGRSLHWEVKGGWKRKGSIDSGRAAD